MLIDAKGAFAPVFKAANVFISAVQDIFCEMFEAIIKIIKIIFHVMYFSVN